MIIANRVVSGLNIKPLLEQIQSTDLWNYDNSWQPPKSPCRTDNIVLRQTHDDNWANGIKELPIWLWDRPARKILFEVEPILKALKVATNCDVLGKIAISRMQPGFILAPHKDATKRPVVFERYQIPLSIGEGVNFIVNGSPIVMVPGEAWWFDKTIMHSVENNSNQIRLAMIVEIRSINNKEDN